ncbi:HD domain-containing protein [Mesorhizobium sp. M0999]|uniref:HD domain-containing protein n=1 Tax=Mesorhizobium sp. M0999 TaxID=2957045 RepID=UPI00333D548B
MRAPEVQRLRNIRMCNINSLLITGASEISRFEHSLGVVRLAKEWSYAANASVEETIAVSAAAMLHDIKTAPFGHSVEYIFSDSPDLRELEHQRVGGRLEHDFFQRTRANVSYMGAQFAAPTIMADHWPLIAQTIAGAGRLGPLISGSMDLDNIDNVVRLAYHVGLATQEDSRVAIALARDLRIESGILSISNAGIAHVKRWQSLRHHLYRYLLHDWAEFSAKGMLTKAIELATSAKIIGTDSWILTDDALINLLISASIGETQDIGAMIKRLMLAELYEPVIILRTKKTSGYREIANPKNKRAIESKMSSILKCQCLVHVILDKAKTDRKVSVYIRDRNEYAEIGHDSDELLVGLFSSRAQGEKVNSRAASEFRREVHPYVGNSDVLEDPLEDPFESAVSQLKLI